MAPLSKSNMGCEQSTKYEEDILKISEKLQKIDLIKSTTPKIEDEDASTYNIDDDEDDAPTPTKTNKNTNDLVNCTKIIEKGPIERERSNNNRLNPYARNNTSGGVYYYNSNELNDFNGVFHQNHNFYNNNNNNNVNYDALSFNNIAFDDLNRLIDDDQLQILSDNSSDQSSVNYDQQFLNLNNIPATIEHNFQTSNRAEKALSNFIDKDKKLKQDIWILVNIEAEESLITKLQNKITSKCSNQNNLNYIYAIIIRLMKEESDTDGKQLLIDYFSSDDCILFKIALKQNVLLMDFILEVYQNLGIILNRMILHQIVNNSHIDLSRLFEYLLNKMFDNEPSSNMFDVNLMDAAGQTILWIILKNISINKGHPGVNKKYLDLILRQNPDATYVTNDGKNIMNYVVDIGCSPEIIQQIQIYYDSQMYLTDCVDYIPYQNNNNIY